MSFDGERVAALRAISRDDIGRARMRTLVDIPEDDIRWLDRLAIETGKSRAALVRDAIASYRAALERDGIERYFGLWESRADVADGLSYQLRLRGQEPRA